MASKNKFIFFIIFLLALLNMGCVFLNWIHVTATADVDLFIVKSEISVFEKLLRGIHLPGGILGLVLPVVFIFVMFKNNKIASLFGLIMIINGVGYALGWFVSEKSLLDVNILTEMTKASLKVIPEPGLITYIISALLLSVLTFFVNKNNVN